MSDGLVPAQQPTGSHLAPNDMYGSEAPPPAANPLERPVAAVRRYKWLIIAVTIAATGIGVLATRFIQPQYEVRATIWVAQAPQRGSGAERTGPIRSAELLNSGGAWIELFRSYKVVDEVVRKLGLFVQTADKNDKPGFASFTLAHRYAPGRYQLTIDRSAKKWSLATAAGLEVERGAPADSVGRKVGFQWVIPASAFEGEGIRKVAFTVVPPRDMSLELLGKVGNRLAQGSNFLHLSFVDTDPALAAQVLNLWVDEFVGVATNLKKQYVVELANVIEGQLKTAEKATLDAESAYQNFRVNTIILPTEGGPVAARGTETERDPALTSYSEQKIQYNNLRHDREALEQNLLGAAQGKTSYEGLLLIPSVAQSPAAQALRQAFDNQYALQARLATEKLTFTDQHPQVIETSRALENVKTQTIPSLGNQLLTQLKERERDYERRIQLAGSELREIPPRTIEERRLSRAVTVSEDLYTTLKGRAAEARLAEASAAPDVTVHDTATAPLSPTKNTSIIVILMGFFGGFGAAIALALLLDRLDAKVRYAEQATSELGLVIAGTVPRVPKGGIDAKSPEQVVQFVESFRTLRMHVMHSGPGQKVTLAVTSAAPGDGKSMVSTNLALSFAEAGLKTVLIDGDTRRGSLHRMHGLKGEGGLTEFLAGAISVGQAVRATAYANLSLVSCGARHPRSPELLASPRLKSLVDTLSQSFDVVIFDTPPLAAGIDGYAISAAAGRVLMVLRMGQTERRLASAKLATLDRLPVHVVGAVLNAVPLTGEFQYYMYSPGYSVDTVDTAGELADSSTR